jgi:hypothetical protein
MRFLGNREASTGAEHAQGTHASGRFCNEKSARVPTQALPCSFEPL